MHKSLYIDWIIRDKILHEIEQLKLLVEEDVKQFIESLKLSQRLPIKDEYVKDLTGKKSQKSKRIERSLNKKEKEKLLKQYKIQDVMKWEITGSLDSQVLGIDMIDLLRNENVKKLIFQIERLRKIDFINPRFTNIDEQNLNQHLQLMGSKGWKLHSMNPVGRSLYDLITKEGWDKSEFNINVTEGYFLVWEKD